MSGNIYESDRMLHDYLLFHYGTVEDLIPWRDGPRDAYGFPERCVDCLDLESLSSDSRALDLGCSVGRSTIELSKYCSEVIGIDYSQAFIDAANQIKREGSHTVNILESGAHVRKVEVHVPVNSNVDRITFQQGDAHELADELGQFDVVIACNLMCRLKEPRRVLERFSALVKPGGQLFLTTPCTWLEEFTDKEKWLGGQNEAESTLDAIQLAFKSTFELVKTVDIPFVFREHYRKYQWTMSQGSLWRRK